VRPATADVWRPSYDEARVRPTGSVGEIVIPAEVGTSVQQFARSSYRAGCTSGAADCILVTVHVLRARRIAEHYPLWVEFRTCPGAPATTPFSS
jgi:hypothetical protein